MSILFIFFQVENWDYASNTWLFKSVLEIISKNYFSLFLKIVKYTNMLEPKIAMQGCIN